MTPQELLGYVALVAGKMDLSGWRLSMSRNNDADFIAQIAIYDKQKTAEFIASEKLLVSTDRELIRETVVHELVHLHLHPLTCAVKDVKDVVGTSAYTILDNSFDRASEIATDTLARIIAPTMPLIKKVKHG